MKKPEEPARLFCGERPGIGKEQMRSKTASKQEEKTDNGQNKDS